MSSECYVNFSHIFLHISDSVIIIGDNEVIPQSPDDDVIFINEERPTVMPDRITAIVNLCSPERSNDTQPERRKRKENAELKQKHVSPSPTSENSNDLDDSSTALIRVQCPVCLENLQKQSTFSTMCGHLFCEPCIRRAIAEHKKCPICKKKLTPKLIHRIYL